MPTRSEVLVLLSGGLDSSACVEFFRSQGRRIRALFIDYGQQSADREAAAATAVASFFGIPISAVKHSPITTNAAGLILGRNAFLVSCALLNGDLEVGTICIGIHSGTNYWDCSPEFVSLAQAMLDGYTNGQVKLSAPFLDWTKKEIWDFCKATSVPIELTYSCELGKSPPCGQCQSCA